MIVVTGASGHVGGLVAAALARRGERMRLLVRDPARAPEVPGADVAVADYGDPASLGGALRPGDRVYMVPVHESAERRVALHRAFVDAAVAAGVAHVVYLSCFNASEDAIFVHARSHGATETMLRESGLPFTFVRMGMWADTLRAWFDAKRVCRGPGGAGRTSFTYRPELAEAIAAVLAGEGHEGRTYDVTTPESVTLAELARIASDASGLEYRYDPYTAERWVEMRLALGLPEWTVRAGVSSYAALEAGELEVVTDDYRRLTGLDPLPLAELAALQRGALRDETGS